MKKVAAINDLSGIGKCSLTVAIPILSALKVQCCPFPTAILSSQTGFSQYTFLDLTDEMEKYSSVWKNLGLEIDTIFSGFLGSIHQIDIVSNFIKENPNSMVIVDPVLGDDGVLYPIFDKNTCEKMKDLVKLSDLITPNLTEACLLTNVEYKNNFISGINSFLLRAYVDTYSTIECSSKPYIWPATAVAEQSGSCSSLSATRPCSSCPS